MSRPWALDLCCAGGGASKGLYDGGFNVVGVDIKPQRHYPFPFLQSDVFDLPREFFHGFAVVWASFPCQRYTRNARQKGTAGRHPDLIPPGRDLLDGLGLPYVMENVPDAPLRPDLMLCGSMFGLRLVRHRVFESNVSLVQPEHGEHHPQYVTVTGHAGGSSKRDGGEHFGSTADWREAMGIDWLPGRSLKEAVPPAYSEHIAASLLAALTLEEAA